MLKKVMANLASKLTDGGHKMVKMSIREIYGEIPENSTLEKSMYRIKHINRIEI
jgi:hypothetical protein